MSDPGPGQLKVTVHNGRIYQRAIMSWKPFVILTLGNKSAQTQVASGKNPNWHHILDFERESEGLIEISLYDKGMIGNSVMGKGAIGLKKILLERYEKGLFKIFNNGKEVGELMIELCYMQRQPHHPVSSEFPRFSHQFPPEKPPSLHKLSMPLENPKRDSSSISKFPMDSLNKSPASSLNKSPASSLNKFPMDSLNKSPMDTIPQGKPQISPIPDKKHQEFSTNQSGRALDIVTHGITVADIMFEDQIYKSANGKQSIYNARILPKNFRAAVKITYCSTPDEFNKVQREAFTMLQVKHPNICKVYTTLLDTNFGTLNSLFVMEKIEGGDVGFHIETRTQSSRPWPESELITYFCDLISGFGALQTNGIVHSDIKPQNIVLTPSNEMKIIDFGISLMSSAEYFSTTQTFKVGGTVPYFSPLQLRAYIEFISGQNTTGTVRHNPYKSDVFSLGLTFYHMASLQAPTGLNDLSNPRLQENINQAVERIPYSSDLKTLILHMLWVEEEARPDFLKLKDRLKLN